MGRSENYVDPLDGNQTPKIKKRLTRRFLGKTENFIDKAEQRFEQKHLAAYLRGAKYFIYGRVNSWSQKLDRHAVKQEIREV